MPRYSFQSCLEAGIKIVLGRIVTNPLEAALGLRDRPVEVLHLLFGRRAVSDGSEDKQLTSFEWRENRK